MTSNQSLNSDKIITPRHSSSLTWLALFTTSGTLICCALPILFVSLVMGATVASLVSHFPILVVLSEHKLWVFSISALLIFSSFIILYRPGRTCINDPKLGPLCQKSHLWNQRLLWISLIIWSIGFFIYFLAFLFQLWFDQL